MRNLIFTVLLTASAFCASAQRVYFIYLQSDNYNPFYVKMNDKIYSSATSGYLILSNLVDSTYNFSIGFPSSSSESRFVITIDGKDKGFLIRNAGSALFDLQNLTTIDAQKDESSKNISYIKRNDSFASLLSKAANDTSLLYAIVKTKEDVLAQKDQLKTDQSRQPTQTTASVKTEVTTVIDTASAKPVARDVALETKKQDSTSVIQTSESENQNTVINTSSKEETKKDTLALTQSKESGKDAAIASKQDTIAFIATDTVAKRAEPATVVNNTTEDLLAFKRSQIKKHSESSTSEGFGLVFYDQYDGGQDTIRLIIPNPPFNLKRSNDQDTSLQQNSFIHVDELKKDTVQKVTFAVDEKKTLPVKSQCKSMASNNDFFKLRKNMAGDNTDEDMVEEAKKYFKNKCFTTEQIKNLSALFLTSAGKYLFFDAAYLHVSDQENFSSLESEIKDDYYLKRFKALIGE